MKRILLTVSALGSLLCVSAQAYGPRGHRMVGAIADNRLANNQAVTAKINQLLDGLTLAEAALLPDEIKDWDYQPDKHILLLSGHDGLTQQLHEFVDANPAHPAPGSPSHHEFHFTDVPVGGTSLYEPGTVGRSKWDLVHMIPFCIDVLQGKVPESNERKITKPVALILLAHYMGDLAQPLHVGAQYFDNEGKPSNPDQGGQAVGDEGGNKLSLLFQPAADPPTHHTGRLELHGYWDDQTVDVAVILLKSDPSWRVSPRANDAQIATILAQREPAGWKIEGANFAQLTIAYANDILPAANEAHQRLKFEQIVSQRNMVRSGKAVADGSTYPKWAGGIVRDAIHKGGWRLADMLTQILN